MAQIFHNDQINLDSPYELNVSALALEDTGPEESAPGPRVRIIQSDAHHTVLEVVCACGESTVVRCDH